MTTIAGSGKRGAKRGVWSGIRVDDRLVWVLKAAAVVYAAAAPFFLGAVDADLTAVYAVAFVAGAAAWCVDAVLGALVLMGVVITMVAISRASAAAAARGGDRGRDEDGEDAFPWARRAAAESTPGSAGRGPGPEPVEAFVSEAADGPEDYATSDGERAPEATDGPRFLLDPRSQHGYVTESGMASAQTNEVGGYSDFVYCPLGAGSYSVQGTAAGVGVAPMAW